MSVKILVVEDEFAIGTVIAQQIQQLGYVVDEIVASGEQAIKSCEHHHPDLVLMDIQLNGKIDGIEAARKIAEYEIPVVFLTSHVDSKTLDRAKTTLPNGYLLKPVCLEDLKITLEVALYKHQNEKKLKRREQWLESILEKFQDGVITTDTAGSITYFNPSAERLTGWSAKKALGLSCQKVLNFEENGFAVDTFNLINELLGEAPENGVNRDQIQIISKQKKMFPIDLHVTLLKDEQGGIKGNVITIRDRSNRHTIASDAEDPRQSLIHSLTKRQKEILTYIARGYSTKEIGSMLFISPRTVEFHRQNMMKTLGVHDVVALVQVAILHKIHGTFQKN
ncbi:MAG: response regulator [SAR324 cluster bacterium]|nr:response regulator [SAR324 cluster bacterium]